MISSLCELPDEVLLLIFKYFNPQKDRHTIASLRLTNRRVFRFADTHLYCTITDAIRQNEAHDGQLQCSTWDVVRDLGLSRHIKSISFTAYDFLGQDNRGRYKASTAGSPSEEQFRYALEHTCLPTDVKDELQVKLLEASPAANLALLIALCTNLESITVPCSYSLFHKLLHRVISSATEPTLPSRAEDLGSVQRPIFRFLTHLRLGHPNYQIGITDAQTLLLLPSLQYLNIKNLADSNSIMDTTPLLPAASDAAQSQSTEPLHLHFESFALSETGISKLLRPCGSRPLHLTIRYAFAGYTKNITNNAIGRGLCKHGAHIVSLTLDTTTRDRPYETAVPDSFGFLSSLKSLTTLAVPYYALGSTLHRENHAILNLTDDWPDFSNTLPPSLRTLYILGVVDEGIPPYVVKQALATSALPNLRTIVQVPWRSWMREEWFGHVSDKCVDYQWLRDKKGVDLELNNISDW